MGRRVWVRLERDAHLREGTRCKLLQLSDFDRTLFACMQVARTGTKVRGRADSASGEAERVLTEDNLRGTVVILSGNALDEGLDVDVRRARLRAWRVCTLQAALGFHHGSSRI